ncbi:serine/threonine protein kinase, partial [Pyxidicoccus sp. 3LFB2]
ASARAGAKERDDMAEPAPSGPGLDAAASRRLMTEEQNLTPPTRRRGPMVAIAGALALVGLMSFLIAAWRLGGTPGEGTSATETPSGEDPTLGQGPSEPTPIQAPPPYRPPPPPEPARTEPSRQAAAQDAPREEDDAPEVRVPPKSQRAYITITTNVPARVYIDGERVNRRTPLSRFPIKAGTRLIRLVSTTTGETQESELRFTRGQHRKLVVDSFSAPRR